MNTPSSPMEFLRVCLLERLESLPEGSTIQISAEQLRVLVTAYHECLDLISHMEKVIEQHCTDF